MKKNRIIGIVLIVTLSIFVGIQIYANFIASNNDDNNTTNGDTNPTIPQSTNNLTLIINYGPNNGTIDEFKNVNLTNYKTSVFDLLNKCCEIEYKIGLGDLKYITSINYLEEDPDNGKWWTYTINGNYAVAVNNEFPPNNSIIEWRFSK